MAMSMSDFAKASDLFGINKWSAALPTALAGQLVMGLVPAVLHYTFYF